MHSRWGGHSDYCRDCYSQERQGEERSGYSRDHARRDYLADRDGSPADYSAAPAQARHRDLPGRYLADPDGFPADCSAALAQAQHYDFPVRSAGPDDSPADCSLHLDLDHRGPRVAAAGPDREARDEPSSPEEAAPDGQWLVHRRGYRKPVDASQPPAGS